MRVTSDLEGDVMLPF